MQSNLEKDTSNDFEENLVSLRKNFSTSADNEIKTLKEIKPTFNISSNLRRPDSLDLSMDYGSSSKSIKNGKSMSYDLWVNENITKANENKNKKIDLAGRVSFR
jgi:hypothetical protein